MGNKSSSNKEILENLSRLKSNIIGKVENSFSSIPNKESYDFNELFNWKNEIIKLIIEEIDNLINNKKKGKDYKLLNQKGPIKSSKQETDKKKQNEKNLLNLNIKKPVNNSNIQGKIKVNVSRVQKDKKKQNKKLDNFTSKDIQEENKEITRIFQKESLNYINDDEETENETIGQFLKGVALISRRAYNNSNKLFKDMFDEYLKVEDEEINISDLENDEQLKKEFSSWVKEYEQTTEGKKKYEQYFKQFKGEGTLAKEKYIHTLFSQLTILYFHCELSFPIVDVNFDSEIIFNHEKMIDFINKGNNRKVNFVILPSLFSNGNYLENGKSWVFTYKKDTFKFDEQRQLNFEFIVDRKKKFNKKK